MNSSDAPVILLDLSDRCSVFHKSENVDQKAIQNCQNINFVDLLLSLTASKISLSLREDNLRGVKNKQEIFTLFAATGRGAMAR